MNLMDIKGTKSHFFLICIIENDLRRFCAIVSIGISQNLIFSKKKKKHESRR